MNEKEPRVLWDENLTPQQQREKDALRIPMENMDRRIRGAASMSAFIAAMTIIGTILILLRSADSLFLGPMLALTALYNIAIAFLHLGLSIPMYKRSEVAALIAFIVYAFVTLQTILQGTFFVSWLPRVYFLYILYRGMRQCFAYQRFAKAHVSTTDPKVQAFIATKPQISIVRRNVCIIIAIAAVLVTIFAMLELVNASQGFRASESGQEQQVFGELGIASAMDESINRSEPRVLGGITHSGSAIRSIGIDVDRAQVYLSDDLNELTFRLDEITYRLPLPFSQLEAAGWQLSPETQGAYLTGRAEVHNHIIRNGENELHVSFINLSSRTMPVPEVYLSRVRLSEYAGLGEFALAGNVVLGQTTYAQITAIHGEPDSRAGAGAGYFAIVYLGRNRRTTMTICMQTNVIVRAHIMLLPGRN